MFRHQSLGNIVRPQKDMIATAPLCYACILASSYGKTLRPTSNQRDTLTPLLLVSGRCSVHVCKRPRMCNKRKIYATATIYGCVVECEEGWGGCGTVVRGGVRLGGGGRPLYELKAWGLSCSCVGGRRTGVCCCLSASRKWRQLVLSH